MIQAEQATGTPAIATSLINRRLAAIAFADVAGFSRLMALRDVETVLRWKTLRTEIMEPHMARHGGRIAEIAGDAVLVEFPSVVNAVRWAADVQRAQERTKSGGDPLALHLRIAINVDDVIDEDGILQGDGVNIASRIHQAAEPGQIVVTAAVRDYVMNRLPLTFHHLGTPVMKNITRTVHVYSVEWTEGDRGDPIAQPYLQWASRPTLAVLPFRTISGTDDDSYYGEGITDAIITGLSRNRSLYVIARNSTLRYLTGGKDLRQIASELDVRYLLDGSVQRQGTRLRINTELTDIVGNVSIWAQRYEGSTDDLFEFQDRIASSILSSIEPRVRAVETARVGDRPTESLDAFHCVLRAMSLLYIFTSESSEEAGELLERAIVLDPSKPPKGANLDIGKLAILSRPHPESLSGTPTSWAFDDTKKVFTLKFTTKRPTGRGSFGRGAITEVLVPHRQYPKGYTAKATGATVRSKHNALVLSQTALQSQPPCDFASHSDQHPVRIACRRKQRSHIPESILRENTMP